MRSALPPLVGARPAGRSREHPRDGEGVKRLCDARGPNLARWGQMMPGPRLTIVDLLRGAADALDEAYRGREDVPPASLALIVALRERGEHISSGKAALDEAEPTGATVTQDEP